jgi:hypothetical protein
MTILPIGNDKGSTFIELLVAVAVLSFGLVLLYEAFFSYMDAFNYSFRRLDVQQWMDEKVWEIEDELIRSGILMPGQLGGSFIREGKTFTWTASVRTMGEIEDSFLYMLELDVTWEEISRDVCLSQVAYVQN